MKNIFNKNSKILIVGTSGCGKSTLARKLAHQLEIPDIELDALFWKENWTQSEPTEFRQNIKHALSQSHGFVIHGNYNKVKDLTWGNSNIVLWLDYSRPVVMWRVLKRSILRIIKGDALWAGNKETFQKTFLSKESIILWAWSTFQVRRQQYEDYIKDPDFKNLKIIRFRHPAQVEKFIESIQS